MATLFHLSGDRILDANGDPYAGALIYFYEAGTTTPQDTYSNNALSSARSNPVECDANGLVPAIWLKKASYKFVIKNSDASVTIITVDNFDASDGLATIWCGTAGGTADALTLTVTGITALETNRKYRFLVASDNTTTTPTVNINAYGAKTIVRADGTAINVGDLKSGFAREMVYLSGIDKMQLLGLDGADGSDATAGQHTIWVPAIAMYARTTTGAAVGSTELATNDVMLKSFDFDASADEHVQFAIQMPKSWDEGTLIWQALWSHPSTTTNFGVVFFMQAVAFADDDALDTAFGTAVSVTDTGGTTDDLYISPESAALTVAGTPGAEEYVVFQIYRDVSDAADTLAVDARLLGVKIHYTTNADTDG